MATTINSVTPYDHPMDVNVVMTVLRPQPVKDLGNILLLNATSTDPKAGGTLSDTLNSTDILNGLLLRKTDKTTGAIYREYKNLDAVAVDYKEGTPVYKKASAYFAQSNHSDRIAVLDYDKSKAYEALKAFWYFNWTFAICVDNTIDDSTVNLSSIFEVNKDHFLVLQTDNISQYTQFNGQNYTIGLSHDLDEPMDAAFVGAIATRPVGAVTWKFKNLVGITAQNLTTQELASINQVHAIAYEETMGKGQTSEGTTLSGEYIDLLHGVLWVQTTAQAKLEKMLQENGKIPYESKGIAMIGAVLTEVMNKAYEMGIIMTDDATGRAMFTVTTTPREQQSQKHLSERFYDGASFEYHASSAIHTITVNGTVDSDTVLAAQKGELNAFKNQNWKTS